MAHAGKIGKQEVSTKIELYKTIYIPTVMYNIEAWGKLKKHELENLERMQGAALRRILKIKGSTPTEGILFETGVWRVKEMLT